jgi:hypothetical protein
MNTKVLVAALIGGVLFFLLGWVIYGMLLSGPMTAGSNLSCMKTEETMNMPLLVVANLVWGLTMAVFLSKWGGGVKSFSAGAGAGAIISFLIALGMDLFLFAMSNMWTGFSTVIYDVLGNIVTGGIVGGVIGWWYGRGTTG